MGQGVGGDEIRHKVGKSCGTIWRKKKKSYTLNVEKASSLRRKGVANLLPQKKEGWQFTVFHYVIRKTPGQSKQ